MNKGNMPDRHLLVAVSEDPSIYFGLRFVSRFFSNREHLRVTLLYLAPSGPQDWGDEDFDIRQLREKLARDHEERGHEALEMARSLFLYEGFPRENLDTKFVVRSFSEAQELMLEGQEGLYDAVVVGRRGIQRIEHMLDREPCRVMLDQAFAFPLWVCRRPDVTRVNVLLCADGSAPSLRMADHVGFILSEEPRHSVVVLHVTGSATPGGAGQEDSVLDATVKALTDAGLDESRISTRVIGSADVARTIQAEASNHRHAVVACGRTGFGAPVPSRFLGSVTDSLFRNLSGAVLWVSR